MEIKRRLIKTILTPITVPSGKPVDTKVKITKWERFWVWMNGKKLKIGAVCTLVAGVLLILGVKGPITMISGALTILLDGVGSIHKVLKTQTKYGEKGEFSEKDLINLVGNTINNIKGWIALIKFFKKKGGDD